MRTHTKKKKRRGQGYRKREAHKWRTSTRKLASRREKKTLQHHHSSFEQLEKRSAQLVKFVVFDNPADSDKGEEQRSKKKREKSDFLGEETTTLRRAEGILAHQSSGQGEEVQQSPRQPSPLVPSR